MNQRNRLATARVGTTQVGSYVYDALERLAIRTTSNVSPAGTTHFAYDLSGKVLIEANGSNGATVREYVWFDDMPLAIVANVDTASPQLLHVHADHLDRPIMLTNTSKANVWEAVYRPFGEVHAITGTATQNLRFPGQYFLFETGLAHNWHRTYDATIGRYLQADPLGFVAGPSVFAYAMSSPLMLIDPEGLNPRDQWWEFSGPRYEDFRRWCHRKGKFPGDPDFNRDEVRRLYEQWNSEGRPGPDNRGRYGNRGGRGGGGGGGGFGGDGRGPRTRNPFM